MLEMATYSYLDEGLSPNLANPAPMVLSYNYLLG